MDSTHSTEKQYHQRSIMMIGTNNINIDFNSYSPRVAPSWVYALVPQFSHSMSIGTVTVEILQPSIELYEVT